MTASKKSLCVLLTISLCISYSSSNTIFLPKPINPFIATLPIKNDNNLLILQQKKLESSSANISIGNNSSTSNSSKKMNIPTNFSGSAISVTNISITVGQVKPINNSTQVSPTIKSKNVTLQNTQNPISTQSLPQTLTQQILNKLNFYKQQQNLKSDAQQLDFIDQPQAPNQFQVTTPQQNGQDPINTELQNITAQQNTNSSTSNIKQIVDENVNTILNNIDNFTNINSSINNANSTKNETDKFSQVVSKPKI